MPSLRLLLIDDNPNDRTLARRELEREFENLQTLEISDLSSFELALEQAEFNFIITDYQLHWTNGLEILRTIRERFADLPIIMFTGTGSEEVAVAAMKLGLDDYVLKSPKHYLRLAATVRFVWQRFQQKKALQEAESRYRRLFEQVPVALYRLDPTGQILEANPTLVQMLGYPDLETALSSNLIDDGFDAETSQIWKATLEQEGVLQEFEAPLQRRDGTTIWVRHNVRSLKRESNQLLYYEGAMEDVTERKQAEQERAELLAREQAARIEAEAASRIKDEFLATLSHELRTPLNGILGWAQLLRRGHLSPERVNHALEVIERNVKSQTQIIEDLLDVSRIIRGQMHLNLTTVNLKWVIEAALDTMRPAAEAKAIQLVVQYDSNVSPIKGDPDRLQQAIWNLLVNGIKFTPPGGSVTIRLKAMPECVQIQVSDTGKGIRPDFIPQLFERFRQLESTSTRTYGGLGLGLALVRHLVELHGGTVFAQSPGEGQGSTFTIELPTLASVEVAPTTDEKRISTNELPKLQGVKVLLVEDDRDSRELMALILEQSGAKVTAASSVKEALAAFNRQLPDILVSDISMPEADGYDLIRQIRDRPSGRDLPAIALTAYARHEDQQQALEAGFQMHISKPVELIQLATAVASLMQQ